MVERYALRIISALCLVAHSFSIIDDEMAFLRSCGTTPTDGPVIGIEEQWAAACPACGRRLMLVMGRSYLKVLAPTPDASREETASG